jgi:hypothetical protein
MSNDPDQVSPRPSSDAEPFEAAGAPSRTKRKGAGDDVAVFMRGGIIKE